MNWIWFFVKISGLVAYLLLTLSILAGIYRHIPRTKAPILEFHQIIGQIALLVIAVHAFLLFFDHYEPYSLLSVLIPFMSENHRFLTGIGTMATYLLIFVIITSDFMKVVGRSAWKKAHYLVFPIWFLAWIHSVYIGTDSGTVWAQGLYWGSFLAIVVSTLYMVTKMIKNNKTNEMTEAGS